MSSPISSLFQRYLLPGFVFTAAIIGGGYSTGRELVEFFLPAGPLGGLLGMLVSMLVFSTVMAISFELARLSKAYDYQSFIRILLGPFAVLFEIAYLLLLVIVLAVLGAAAGTVAHDAFGLPALAGTLGLMAVTGALLFLGSSVIESVLAVFAVILYGIYAVIVVWSLSLFGDDIAHHFAAPPGEGWAVGGLRYAGYNIAVLPAVLFCLRHQSTRRETLISGLIAGPLAMLPGVLLFVAMIGRYPEIGAAKVPLDFLLAEFNAGWFQSLFQLVFFGILVKSGVALLHALNERAAALVLARRGVTLPRSGRLGLALTVMLFSVFAASAIGLVDLIAKGYGLLAYAFLTLLVLPVITLGVWKISRSAPGA